MDVHGENLRLELARLLLLGLRGLLILLHVELAQQHDGFLSEDATGDRVGFVDAWTETSQCLRCATEVGNLHRVDVQHASGASEPLVPAAKVHGADAVLAKHRGAHDARLDCNVEVRLLQVGDGVLGQDAGQSNKLGVPRAVQGAVRLVHATTKDLAILYKHTANWGLVALECKFGLSLTRGSDPVAGEGT